MPCCWRRPPRSWTGAAQRVLDVGAGVGVVGLAVARRVADARGDRWWNASRSSPRSPAATSRATALPTRVRVIEADVSRRLERAAAAAARGRTASITSSPIRPTTRRAPARSSVDALKAGGQRHAGRQRSSAGRASWRAMAAPGRHGHHHPSADALGELLAAFAGRFGGSARPSRSIRATASRRSACSCRASRAAARRCSCGRARPARRRATASRPRPRRSCAMAPR